MSILGLSSSKVLMTKVGSLEFKLVALETSVGSVLVKLDHLCAGLATCNVQDINMPAKQKDIIMDKFNGIWIFTFGLDKAVVINNFLACHISKVKEIPGHVVSICLLFKDKISVLIVRLYAGISPGTRFGLASEVNFFIAWVVNSSTFVVLGGNFNEDRSKKSTSLGFCSDLSLNNSKGVDRVIDYIFVSESLILAVAGHEVGSVAEFFDTDHNAVSISVNLGGLLDVHLNHIHKQVNKNRWKFKLKEIDNG
ncbi:hypothetical protein G9A89_021977 [Geosiphon pyriformis]|nr:hypothetical protein G9A89_021977 [Geosiphon pyriformis]